MIAAIALVRLVGYVVLLLWGMHMVQSGIVRAFGPGPRRVTGRTLQRFWFAAAADDGDSTRRPLAAAG